MTSKLVEIIEASAAAFRDHSLDAACLGLSVDELLAECSALEDLRRHSDNLYDRVRSLFFLYAIHKFELPRRPAFKTRGHLSHVGWQYLLERRYEEAIAVFLAVQARDGANDVVSSALAAAYRGLGFQTLADQVRSSVRSAPGNEWMFQIRDPADQPLRIRPELREIESGVSPPPRLLEQTAVRLDLTHSAWSDIFFLAMDFPTGARVINLSVDLGVRGRDSTPKPPIKVSLRIINEPVLRLVSVDLEATASITTIAEVFDFSSDYLGLLKAGVIASGLVPPGVEGSNASLTVLLEQLCGRGRGMELVSHVRDIPKGSRLAVSTNLVASLIAVCMRATDQTEALTGGLTETERRIVASRAILAEWLGGSGGGWQDSGGIWPGLKVIRGQEAKAGDPEFGISRGRLLPTHEILGSDRFSGQARKELQDSLVLFHGGMAQNVGPVLEMVTERYLLRSEPEWTARTQAVAGFDRILAALAAGNLRDLAKLTEHNFAGPIQTIIPGATNPFTEAVIDQVRDRFGNAYRGFAMLGGMSGGGMAMFFEPSRRNEACDALLEILTACKRQHESALPFATEPVVYDFRINDRGTTCELLTGQAARRAALGPNPRPSRSTEDRRRTLAESLTEGGFNHESHERIRRDLRDGRIGLSKNRLPATTVIEDVTEEEVVDTTDELPAELTERGLAALRNGEAGIVTFAGGAASRWTQGAGVTKALNPFCQLGGKHRSFLEVHLAKTRRLARESGVSLPHIFTTSLFTHEPIRRHLDRVGDYGFGRMLLLSPGRSVGLRMVPMERDLRFLWEERAQQILDQQAQKVEESRQAALIEWAKHASEGSDYTDNLATQCLHPVGHWFEIPNLLRNGVLADLLSERPQLRWLLAHNIDTVGVNADPTRLGLFIERGRAMSFEVVPRRMDDVGGGLARVDGRVCLVGGLAMPDEEVEFTLSYYNTGSSWIDIEQLLDLFGLTRSALRDAVQVDAAIARVGERIPTYVTIRDVKKRWGHGQEDVFPVSQFEKLWGDMTRLPEVSIDYFAVDRKRGQQLKDPAQIDGWRRDGSADYVEALADWSA